jgi:shikimate kinase
MKWFILTRATLAYKSNKMNIILIGFPGSGKSTIGKQAAQLSKSPFLDLDSVIEQQYLEEFKRALSCREIHAKLGRDVFLTREFQATQTIAGIHNTIIATGGGAVVPQNTRTALQAIGSMVYLYVRPEIIYARLSARGFPVFMHEHPSWETLLHQWRERDSIYRVAGTCIVDASELSIEDTARAVVSAAAGISPVSGGAV